MAAIIGYWLSGAIALGIVLIGARFFFAPYAAAAGYGVSVGYDARWDAYLSAKAIRDIASGLFTAILILNRSVHLLGWFMLAATIIPLTDAVIVLRHGGTQAATMRITNSTATVCRSDRRIRHCHRQLWSPRGAQRVLQARAAVIDGRLHASAIRLAA